MKRIVTQMSKLNFGKMTYAVVVLSVTTAISLHAQSFTTLHSFDGTDGGGPEAALVQATNGDLYGTTNAGANGYGTVFKITPAGTLTTVHSFCSQSGCTDGEFPTAGLVQATTGDLYGTTSGTVFKITPNGTLTTLYNFCSQGGCTDDEEPLAGLVQAAKGDLYGTTHGGVVTGFGTVFKITPSGTPTTLYSFCSGGTPCPDGAYPDAGLVQATNGDFYGTTNGFGPTGTEGTVFKITPGGTLTTLYSFCAQGFPCIDGEFPAAGLVQATNGDFYGTTYGDANYLNYGTVFKITPSGTLTTLYSFCAQFACADGEFPAAALVQATDGNFYGTTSLGGTKGYGTIFKITPSGTLTTLYSFCSQTGCTDGEIPYGGLIQDTNGDFYGTTEGGGAANDGTVFSLSVGLGPFVATRPTSGDAGTAIKILGTNLTGATSVTFNGTPAVFTVVRPSEIATTVPTGATTGKVQVVTPGGALSSNVSFRVP